MSKIIYEQAKRDLISLTAKFVIPSVDETDYGCIYDSCHFYNTLDEQEESYLKNVEQALEQAQKQEKLLELYRKYFWLSNVTEIAWSPLVFNKVLKIKNEIKELEK